jgi:hypothetical protein
MHGQKALNFIHPIYIRISQKVWVGGGGVQRECLHVPGAHLFPERGEEEMNDMERGEFSFPWKTSKKNYSIAGKKMNCTDSPKTCTSMHLKYIKVYT